MAQATSKKEKDNKLTLERFDGRKWVEDRKVAISEDDARVFNLDSKKRGFRYKEVIKDE